MTAVKKFIIEYKDGTKEEIKKGLIAFEEPYNNLEARFLNVDSKDIPVILQALIFALKEAEKAAKSFKN